MTTEEEKMNGFEKGENEKVHQSVIDVDSDDPNEYYREEPNVNGDESEAKNGDDSNYDVVIVGSGLSGLYAAYCLRKKTGGKNLNVVVVDAKDRVGGRLLTVPLMGQTVGDYWDLGWSFLNPRDEATQTLLRELNMNSITTEQPLGHTMIQLSSEKIHKQRKLTSTGVGLIDSLDLSHSLRRLKESLENINTENIFDSTDAESYDSMTAEQLLTKQSFTNYSREAIDCICIANFGVRSSTMSALFFLLFCKANGIDWLINNLSGAGETVNGGAQLLTRKLASAIGLNSIVRETAVLRIDQSDTGVEVTCRNGKENRSITCQYVILAIPPDQVYRMDFDPPLPPVKRLLVSHFIPSPIVKFVVTYQENFWQSNDCTGNIVASGFTNDPSVVHPISSTYAVKTGENSWALTGFLNPEWACSPSKERKRAVVEDLVRFLGPKAEQFQEYRDSSWFDDCFSSGLLSHVPPGGMQYYATSSTLPIGRVHLCCPELSTKMGSIAGALESAEKAAKEVLYRIRQEYLTEDEMVGTAFDKSKKNTAVPRRHYASSKVMRSIRTDFNKAKT